MTTPAAEPAETAAQPAADPASPDPGNDNAGAQADPGEQKAANENGDPAQPDAPDPEAKTDPKPPEKPLSSQHAELVKRASIAERKERQAAERETTAAKQLRTLNEERERFEAEKKKLTDADYLQTLELVAQAKGIDLATLMRRAVQQSANGGKLSPEEQAKVDAEQRSQREQQLEERLAAAEKREQERADREKQAEADRHVANWQSETVAAARDAKEALPYLSDLPDREVAARALTVANDYYSKTNEIPDRKELLEFLEAQEKQRYESELSFHESRFRRLGKLPTVAETVRSDPGNPQTGAQDTGPAKAASRTLTNNGASQRPATTNGQNLSERDRIAWAAELL